MGINRSIIQKKGACGSPNSRGSESGFFVGKVGFFCRKSRGFLSEKSGFFVGKVRVFCRVGCAQSIYLRNRLFFVRADAAEPSLGMSECQDDRKCAPPSRSGSDRTRSLPSALYTPSPSPRHSPESALASIHPLLRCTAAPGIISKRALRDSAHLHPQRHVQQLKRAMKRRAHQ